MRTRRCARALEDCEAAKSRWEWRLQLAPPKGLNKLANGGKKASCRARSLVFALEMRFFIAKSRFAPSHTLLDTFENLRGFNPFELSEGFRQSGMGEQAPQPQPPLPVFAKNLSDFRAQKLQGNDFCSGKWDFSPQKVVLPHHARCWIRLKTREGSILSSFQKAFRQSGAAENGGLPF